MEEYIIEEIDSNDVSEAELSQFKETKPIQVADIIKERSIKEEVNESALIREYMSGESEFPDIYAKLEPEEYDDEENEYAKELNVEGEGEQSVVRDRLQEADTGPNTSMGNDGPVNRSRSRKRSVLNATLQGLMGEANLAYARGQIEMAEKICLEIIRQNPLASEPFFTLAEIYEIRDREKYMNFLTIAAHLNPGDLDQWIRLAEMHAAQGNFQRASNLYSKAIKIFPKDYDLRFRKAKILEAMGDKNAAMFTYLRMISHVPLERAEFCLEIAKNVTRHFYALKRYQLSLDAMECAYRICAHIFSIEDLNLYMELLIMNKSYAKVLQSLRENTNLKYKMEKEGSLETIFEIEIPSDFVADIRAKLAVCLIYVKAFKLLDYLIQDIHEHMPVQDDGFDLYADIAEALMNEKKYEATIKLLEPITSGEYVECPAFIWLRHAECLRQLNKPLEAIESLYKVIALAPYCYDAKFTLSALLKQQGRPLEAVKALEQSGEAEEGQSLNARLLYEKCLMLQQIGEMDNFLDVGYVLLSRRSIKLRNREELYAAASGGSFYNADGLKVILQIRNIKEDPDKTVQDHNKSQVDDFDLSAFEEYSLFLDILQCAFAQRKFAFIERLCFAMVTTKRFASYHVELGRIIILACYFNNDCTIAFTYLRELISKSPNQTALWNLLSLFIQKSQDLRYHRYISRLVHRQPSARLMRIFLAHYHLHCSSYKYALKIYAPLFKEQQQPVIALCMAVVFNQLASQKKVLRKTASVAQAIAFAHKYMELRKAEACLGLGDDDPLSVASAVEQETYYNMGRIYHQAGLTHLAIDSYERGLAVRHNDYVQSLEKFLGLQQEIAYNLHLIYRSSGNLRKARQYLYQYCVV